MNVNDANFDRPFSHTPTAAGLTTQIRSEVRAFANATSDFANEVLGHSQYATNSHASGPTTVHHHYHESRPSWFWQPWGYWGPSHHTVYVAPSCPPRNTCSDSKKKANGKEKSDHTGLYLAAAVVAGVVGLCTLVSSGTTVGKYTNLAAELSDTKQLKARLLDCQNLDPKDQKLVNAALKTIDLKERVCLRLVNASVDDWHSQATLMLGCSAGVAGSVIGLTGLAAGTLAAPLLLAGGAVAGTIAACRMLFKSGFDSANNQNARDAKDLQLAVAVLRYEVNS